MKMVRRRLARWALPVAILVAVILVRWHLVAPGLAVALVAASEGTTILLGGIQATRAVSRTLRQRRAGVDFWDALTDGIAVFVPRPVARVIALEPRVWLSIFVWLFRRPRPDATTFPYAADSILGFFLLAVGFSAPIELLLVEALVPWSGVRLVLVLLEIYTFVWLLGYWASLAVLPHRLERACLMLHFGLLFDAPIPYANIATVAQEQRPSANGCEGYHLAAERQELALVIGGATNVVLTLHTPHVFMGLLRPMPPVQTILLKVDEPERFMRAVTARMVGG